MCVPTYVAETTLFCLFMTKEINFVYNIRSVNNKSEHKNSLMFSIWMITLWMHVNRSIRYHSSEWTWHIRGPEPCRNKISLCYLTNCSWTVMNYLAKVSNVHGLSILECVFPMHNIISTWSPINRFNWILILGFLGDSSKMVTKSLT